MEPSRIRVAHVAPPACASCFQQKPQERHIDFGAAYDGPMVPAAKDVVGIIGQSIDDLVICETCVKEAAALVGLVDAEGLRDVAALELANGELHDRITALQAHVRSLETAAGTRQALGPAPALAAALPSRGPQSRPARPKGAPVKPKGRGPAKPKGQARGRQKAKA